jgi:hypothetical protein
MLAAGSGDRREAQESEGDSKNQRKNKIERHHDGFLRRKKNSSCLLQNDSMIPSAFPSPLYLTSSTWAGPNEERHAGPTLMQAYDSLAGTGILTFPLLKSSLPPSCLIFLLL